MSDYKLNKSFKFLGYELIRKTRLDAARKKLQELDSEISQNNSEVEQLKQRVKQLKQRVSELNVAAEAMKKKLAKALKETSETYDLLDLALAAHGCQEPSMGQLKQDIFVLFQTKFKTGGFFVEFGATNGFELSNTYLLEKSFGWDGILAEPAPMWHEQLKKNRDVSLEFDCVWHTTGEVLEFNMTDAGEYSTVNSFSDSDFHSKTRETGKIIPVRTVSLNDLLKRHNAPKKIDYLSIDTEGSEYEILSNFDFSEYEIDIITCEHNFTLMGEEIFSLLSQHGYKRVFEGTSRWDHWYVKE